MNRRHLLAGAAGIPVAGAGDASRCRQRRPLPAPPFTAGPRRYRAEPSYDGLGTRDWDEDSAAVALSDEAARSYCQMARTPPRTAEGFALMLAAILYEENV